MSSLRVVGAGVGRTGTHSLKLALERLLPGPCHHMIEVMARPADFGTWQAAAEGNLPDWGRLFAGYAATVDWPAAAFWRELADAYPEAVVLLSSRPTAEWWCSARQTIFATSELPPGDDPIAVARRQMTQSLLSNRFTPDFRDEQAACAAYERHNATVRDQVPRERLVEWSPGEGWEPLCSALSLPVPDEPFPHVNSTDEFRSMVGLGPATS